MKPTIPVKPERPKVKYFLDERELSPAEVELLQLEKATSVSHDVRYDATKPPVKPVRPAVQYR